MARVSSLPVFAAVSVFIAGAVVGAQETSGVGARVQKLSATSETSSGGGPFSLQTRSANLLEAVSTGGAFRLVFSTTLKAEGGVFLDDFESGDTENWSLTVPDQELPSGAVVAFGSSDGAVIEARDTLEEHSRSGSLCYGGSFHDGNECKF